MASSAFPRPTLLGKRGRERCSRSTSSPVCAVTPPRHVASRRPCDRQRCLHPRSPVAPRTFENRSRAHSEAKTRRRVHLSLRKGVAGCTFSSPKGVGGRTFSALKGVTGCIFSGGRLTLSLPKGDIGCTFSGRRLHLFRPPSPPFSPKPPNPPLSPQKQEAFGLRPLAGPQGHRQEGLRKVVQEPFSVIWIDH